jgi:hypothetical protein
MTRLLGTLLRTGHDSSAEPVSPGWQPLPDDIAEWMGMAPYPGAGPTTGSAIRGRAR